MGFWKRQKSKMLIGGALLAIATGALGILKSEETRLQKEIVGCERVIDRETRDAGPDKPERRQLQETIQEREVLQAQQEEIKIGEEEIQEIIYEIERIGSILSSLQYPSVYDYFSFGRDETNYETFKEDFEYLFHLLSLILKLNDDEVKLFREVVYSEGKGTSKIADLFSIRDIHIEKTIFYNLLEAIREPRRQYYGDENSSDYERLIGDSFLTINKWLEAHLTRVMERLNEYNALLKLNDRLVNMTSFSEELRKRLKPQTEKMQEANEKIIAAIQDAEKSRDYIQSKIDELKREAKKKGIKLEEE